MKRLLIATTALAVVGGGAVAEMSITVGGSAELGVDYNSDPLTATGAPDAATSKHSFVHDFGLTFSGSGTTDGGLSFGATAGFDNKSGGGAFDTGKVHVSGSFGTLTIGDNDAADVLAGGIADVGMNGIGVDDVAEGVRGQTAKQFRYDNSFGQIAIAISAGTTTGSAAVAAKTGLWTLNNSTTDEVGVSIVSQTSLGAFDEVMEFIGGQEDTANANNYLPAAPATGTDPFELLRATGFEFEIMRTPAEGEAKESIQVSLADAPAVENRHNIAGFSQGTGDAVLNADGEALDTTDDADEISAFNAYAAAYDLGADGRVGGGDDAPNAVLLATLNQVTAPVAAVAAVPTDSQYAFGMSFEASGITVGIGYDSNKTISMGLGFATGDISANVIYAKGEDATGTMDTTGMGADMGYTFGASTLTLAYARQETDMFGGVTHDAVGLGVSHDLGGGATLAAGFGRVEARGATGAVTESNKGSVGLTFAF